MAKAAKKTAARKPTPKPAVVGEIEAKRPKAYADMESHVSDLVNMGAIAMDQFDKEIGLFIFAVGKLEDILNKFKVHYYAEEFPT
jgi:hypothetical protein